MTLNTQSGAGVTQLGTTSGDYTAGYYASHLGSDEVYSWDSPGWRRFFSDVADKVVSLTGAKRVMDVGCARGLLVQALVERGVDAYGADISETAIDSAHPDIRDRLTVATAVEPMEGSWDLLSCIEVVEHMSPADADHAITNMCAVTDRVLFSSGPGDYSEPTHVNVRPPADWAAAFAEQGFYRRTDVDLTILTPWAVLFERENLDIRAVVHRYEAYAYPMRVEVLDKRAALLEAHRTTGASHRGQGDLDSQIADLKHRLLTSRDHAIGAEATAARATRDAKGAANDNAQLQANFNDFILEAGRRTAGLEQEIQDLKSSTRWRAGGWVAAPAKMIKRVVGR
jgi:SAM-dependent methyltransferase